MLSKAGFPLTNTQISNFFLSEEYTDYFRVQEVLGDLVDTNLIVAESTHSNTQYTLTAAGKETLGFFKDKSNAVNMCNIKSGKFNYIIFDNNSTYNFLTTTSYNSFHINYLRIWRYSR